MKKVLAFALCAAMGLATFSGCGSAAPSSSPAASGASSAAPSAAASSEAASAAPDKVYTIKLAYTPGSLPATDSPDIMYAEVFKKYVEENSKGAIKVDLYPSGQLGSAAETLQGVVGGSIEMSIIDASLINNIYEQAQVLSTPGIFNSVEECDAVINGDWGTSFRTLVREETGVNVLNMHSKGFRCFTTSNKELKTVGDAKGVTFRVMENPVSIKMVEALGAKAVPMPGSEMYVAMQNHVVDGQENPVLNIIQDKTYEVQKYLVLDQHMAGIMAYVMNDKFFNSLPEDLQGVIDAGAAAAMVEAQKVVSTKNTQGIQILEDKGMSVYEPTAEELEAWHKAVLEPCQAYIRSTLGDQAMDDLVGAIEAYRGK